MEKSIERLNCADDSRYDGLEAAIHLARYSFVRELCKGKRVLDIACGEGYGSYLMSQWGATEVHGVDIAEEAIRVARTLFASDVVRFTAAPAEQVDELLSQQSYDLVVSFETIEHVNDPDRFLRAIRKLVAGSGTIVISCPNDWWYYPTDAEQNPFHQRKYRFNEFKEQAETVLGDAASWFFGGPIAGFCNVPADSYVKAKPGSNQRLMLQSTTLPVAFMVPGEIGKGPTSENASYFIGIWGSGAPSECASLAAIPLGMHALREGVFSAWGSAENSSPHESMEQIKRERAAHERAVRHAQLRLRAAQAENELLREAVSRVNEIRQENESLKIAAARYLRVQKMIPGIVRRVLMNIVRALRRAV